ncbi:MAG: YggS family pyridoxal phosphate-dependent enzyme [Nitrospirae bacterium]|nr:YggS family pyridoxal phosphate-dependent enzyme [Nitrospirota bacterium]
METLDDRLRRVRQGIAQAADRAGRDPGSVTLVAVTKTVPVERIREAASLGHTVFGENRVQEARRKIPLLPGLTWHLVGHLQRNKAKYAVELFDLIHSVDGLPLAQEIDRQAGMRGKRQRVLLEVNLGGEAAKTGLSWEAALPLLHELEGYEHLSVEGFMCIPPYTEDPEGARPFFKALRALGEEAASAVGRPMALSMGMSHDFVVAIEEGASIVRIGTAIFGERGG